MDKQHAGRDRCNYSTSTIFAHLMTSHLHGLVLLAIRTWLSQQHAEIPKLQLHGLLRFRRDVLLLQRQVLPVAHVLFLQRVVLLLLGEDVLLLRDDVALRDVAPQGVVLLQLVVLQQAALLLLVVLLQAEPLLLLAQFAFVQPLLILHVVGVQLLPLRFVLLPLSFEDRLAALLNLASVLSHIPLLKRVGQYGFFGAECLPRLQFYCQNWFLPSQSRRIAIL